MTKLATKCPCCGAPALSREAETRKTFAAVTYRCGAQFIAFGSGEMRDCRTGRWSKVS